MAEIASFPGSVAASATEATTDKRRHPRAEINLPATLATSSGSDEVEAVVINFAPGGIFVKTRAGLACGVAVELRFRMLADLMCEARGQVVRRDDERGGVAVAFDRYNPAMESFIHHLAKLPAHLHALYLADVLHPQLQVID